MFYQINDYMHDKLSIFLCGFRKGMSVQNCLIYMVEKYFIRIILKKYGMPSEVWIRNMQKYLTEELGKLIQKNILNLCKRIISQVAVCLPQWRS